MEISPNLIRVNRSLPAGSLKFMASGFKSNIKVKGAWNIKIPSLGYKEYIKNTCLGLCFFSE